MEQHRPQYWLHRITGGNNGLFLSRRLLRDHCILSTGWSDFSAQSNLNKIRESGLTAIEELMQSIWEMNSDSPFPKNRYSLNRFVNEMKSGDIVIVPLDQAISIYRLIDDTIITNENIRERFLKDAKVRREGARLLTSKGEEIDLGFYRKVEPLVLDIPRSSLQKDLYRKTRTLQTNINISDVANAIEELLIQHPSSSPIEYVQLVKNLKLHLDNTSDDRSFEERINYVFEKMRESMGNGIKFRIKTKKKELIVPYALVEDEMDDNIEVVRNVIASYMRGDVFNSIKELDEWWERNKDKRFPYAPIHKNYIYYRTRLKGENEKVVFEEKDLFHVPFNKRGSVTTKRYSLPGYPCLYLGKSIYVCWEEMRRPALSDFATSAIKAQMDFFLLDLRLQKEMYSEENCRIFLRMLPIILACSLKVANEYDNFKPEYILPQLLLHIIVVKNQKKQEIEGEESKKIQLAGIEYTSTAINNDFDFINSASTYYLADCIVVPVKISEESSNKYCEDLAKKFWVARPKCYENEYIKDSLAFFREYLSSLTINNNKIDVSQKLFARKYDSSYFSYMEHSWKESDFKTINVK